MIKHGGGGCLKGSVGIVKIKCKDAGGELTAPETDRAIFGIDEVGGGNLAAMGDDDIVLMKSKQSNGIGQSKLVQGFEDG